ncbi:pleckstrin homology domain-containing family S member 1 [Heteronotia binoei]|uniref:pleckstrin homology domain-containing family S member 1 n=1 Tax=Heteronotia binoei TaxID=13085 RepID=UPI00292F819E|nr:pleckstrin homology domain-containing family S member 1 [Heteronotia binoei]
MDSTYPRRTSMGDYSNGDVYKQGFFIKSPPFPLFNNQSSWKKRHFVLSKSSNGCFLKYHKGQHHKGCIEINKSSEIEIGIGDHERMAAVKRMFKCQPSEVMTIKTEERTYYLIGTDSKDVKEWADFLDAACKEKETQNKIPIQTGPRNRSQSSPAYLDEYVSSISKQDQHEGNEYEEISAFKKRPNSDPSPQEPREQSSNESPRKFIHQIHIPNHVVCEEQTKGKPEKEEDEKSEQPYYATPSSIQAELDHVIAKCNIPVQNMSLNDNNGNQCGDYMPMKNLMTKEKIQPVCANVDLVSCLRSKKTSTDLKGDLGTQQLIESSTGNKKPPPENKTKHLTKVQLSILLSKITDDNQLEEVDILLPQSDAINCLTFTEAIGCICVSQWKAPHHLNCIFHHGDHILAVNDLHVKRIDEVLFFIKRSKKKEVKLTVRRLPDSEIFPH